MSSSLINNRYRKISLLGNSSDGKVFLVEDTKMKNRRLALKCLRKNEIDFLLLQDEFSLLSRLSHPHIAGVYDFEELQAGHALLGISSNKHATYFFTMPFIEGCDLYTATRNLEVKKRFDLLLQLCYALDYLHRSGFVHRDIKPTNVIVNRQGNELRLVDFGLSKNIKKVSEEIAGTLEYLAPEVLDGADADVRSDLYALGLTCYKILQGNLPFQSENPEDIIAAHRKGLDLSSTSIPAPIFSFISEATQKEPWKRPFSLHHGISALREQLSVNSPTSTLAPPLGAAPFIGREKIMEQVHSVPASDPKAILIKGESGSGKSRLLQEILYRTQVQDFLVCMFSASTLGVQSILEVWSARLANELNPQRRIEVEDAQSRWHQDSESLIKLAREAGKPLLLLIDELQSAPAESKKSIEYFLRWFSQENQKERSKNLSVTIIATETYSPSTFVSQLPHDYHWETIKLENFRQEESSQYLQSILGQQKLPSGLLEYLHSFSAGNPFILRTELDHLLLQNDLAWKNGVYQWLHPKSSSTRTPEAIRDLLFKQVNSAPKHFQLGLTASAIFPESFTRADLEALRLKQIDIEEYLLWAIEHHFLERRGQLYRFDRKSLRCLITEISEPKNVKAWHEIVTKRLKQRNLSTSEDLTCLAYHLHKAGFPKEAIQYYLKAAQAAHLARRMDLCIQSLSIALELEDNQQKSAVIKLQLATHLTASARYQEAQTYLESLLDQDKDNPALSPDEQLLAISTFIRILGRKGRYQEAIEIFHDFRSKPDFDSNHFERLAYARLLGQVGSSLIRYGKLEEAEALLHEGLTCARREHDSMTETTLECHQGELALQRGFLKPAKQIYRRTLKRLTQNKKNRADVNKLLFTASVHNNLGKIAALEGQETLALKHYQESLNISRTVSNPAEECISLIHLGNIHYRRNSFKQSEQSYDEALALCQLIQKPREEAIILFNLGNIHFMGGKLQKSLDHHQRSLRVMLVLQDPAGISNSYVALCIVALEIGDFAAAHAHIEEAEKVIGDRNLTFQLAYIKLLRGIFYRHTKDFSKAREFFRIAESQFKSLNLHHELAQTQVEWAEMEIEDKSLSHARTLAQGMLSYARQSNGLDLLVQSLVVLAQTQDMNSSQYLAEAQEIAEKANLKNLLWRVHLTAATLASHGAASNPTSKSIGHHLRTTRRILEENATGLSDDLRQIFWMDLRHRLGAGLKSPTPLLTPSAHSEATIRFRNEALSRGIDQLADLFEINQLLNSQTDLQTLLEFILDTAIKLLRAQRGLILLHRNRKDFEVSCARNFDRTKLDEPGSAFSYSIAKRTIEENLVIITTDALADERFSKELSVNHLKLRSVLSVPLRVHNKTLGALYLDNPRRQGAFSEEDKKLLLTVSDQAALALENSRLRKELEDKIEIQSAELREARHQLKGHYNYDTLVGGASKKMREVFQTLERITDSTLPVFILGETGTGKEMIARAIHFHGPFAKGPFVSENCASIPPLLLESMLFGHVRGAFTDAQTSRKGVFEIANGGTLFLSGVNELSSAMQIKLLRAIQENEIRPLGANYIVNVHLRIITSAEHDLLQLVERGSFRRDLCHHLRGIDISLPALRERREDISLLVKKFLEEFSQGKIRLDRETAKLLYNYNWPGNVRELRHVMERACAMTSHDEIKPEDLPPEIRQAHKPALPKGALPFLEAKKKFERQYLTELLQEHAGNVTRAAAATGLYRQYLHRLLKKHRLA